MQYQKPALVQRQELRMTPQLLQSIQVMTLPLQDLRLRIHEELEANPALDILEETPTVSLDDDSVREDLETYEEYANLGYTSGQPTDNGDSKRQFLEGALSRPESLQEHLLWQLRLQPISEERYEVGELLIRNLDLNGFHIEDPLSVVAPDRHHLIPDLCEMIQTFEPVGTCVSDYRESLLVQARQMPEIPPGTLEIISDQMEALERGRHKEISKKLGLAEEEIQEALELIRHLTPFPGRAFAADSPRYVTPDLSIRKKDGQFVIVLNDEEIPVLGINPVFAQLVGEPEQSVKQFVNNRVKDAQWFIHSIRQRNQTLVRVARAIVEFQREFFLKGKKALVPLTLKDIALEIGVSEATVSRITNGKYVQTEWGIFELKYFFTNSISGAGSGGSRYSKEGVKEVIREILVNEADSGRRMSDQKISDLLAQRGIKLARRTVAKYRSELDISSSYER